MGVRKGNDYHPRLELNYWISWPNFSATVNFGPLSGSVPKVKHTYSVRGRRGVGVRGQDVGKGRAEGRGGERGERKASR